MDQLIEQSRTIRGEKEPIKIQPQSSPGSNQKKPSSKLSTLKSFPPSFQHTMSEYRSFRKNPPIRTAESARSRFRNLLESTFAPYSSFDAFYARDYALMLTYESLLTMVNETNFHPGIFFIDLCADCLIRCEPHFCGSLHCISQDEKHRQDIFRHAEPLWNEEWWNWSRSLFDSMCDGDPENGAKTSDSTCWSIASRKLSQQLDSWVHLLILELGSHRRHQHSVIIGWRVLLWVCGGKMHLTHLTHRNWKKLAGSNMAF